MYGHYGGAYNESIALTAAIVCSHIAEGRNRIICAIKDEPIAPEDSGWQFHCGSIHSTTDGRVWAVGEILECEPSLRPYMSLPHGTILTRINDTNEWKISNKDV
ncbi:hypothetical protein FACS1894170_04810 [Planctomycetales bacterium]|nr:hypothetical protein FACS1894170_04810 [Planctomycetales bacterium]